MDFDDVIRSVIGSTSGAQYTKMTPQQQQDVVMPLRSTPDNKTYYPPRPIVGGQSTDVRVAPWQPPELSASQQQLTTPLPGAGVYTSGNHALGDAANYDARAFGRAADEFGQGHYAAAAGNAVAGAALAVPSAVLDMAQSGFNNLQRLASPVIGAVRSAAPVVQEFARGFTGAAPPAPPATPMMPEFNNARQAAQSRPQSQPQPFATPVTNGDVLASVGQSFGHPTADSAFAASMRTQGNANPSTPEYYTSGIPGAVPPSNKGFVPAGATTGGYMNTGGIDDVGSAYNNFANTLVGMRQKGFQDLHHPELHGVQYPYIERSDEKRPFFAPTAEGRDAFYAAHPTYDDRNRLNPADETAQSVAHDAGYSQTAPTRENYLNIEHGLVRNPGGRPFYVPGGKTAEAEFNADWYRHNPRTFQEVAALMPGFAKQEAAVEEANAPLPGQRQDPYSGKWYTPGEVKSIGPQGVTMWSPAQRQQLAQMGNPQNGGALLPKQGGGRQEDPVQRAIAAQQPMSDREAFLQTLPPHMASAIRTGHFSRDQVVHLLGQVAPQMTHEHDPVWVGKNASANALAGMANLTAHGVTEDKNGNVVVDPRTLQLPADRLRALGADPANGDVASQLIYQYNVHKRTNSIWSQFFNSIIPLMQQGQGQ